MKIHKIFNRMNLLSMTLAGRRATKERIDQLISFGIPEDLLPTLRMKMTPGPKVHSGEK